MMRLILLIMLLPIQVISQDLPVGFVNFHIPRINQSYLDLSVRYDLYTDSKCSNDSFYGYLNYGQLKHTYPNIYLILHLKDTLSKPDSIIPSIGYVHIYTSLPKNTIDTVYRACEESFFTVNKKEGNVVRFALNKNKDLWVKTNQTVKYYTSEKLLTDFRDSYADSTIKLYSKPDIKSLIPSDARFKCFTVKEIKGKWARVVTSEGDPCMNFLRGGINEAWIIWYDKEVLIRPD
jgi:hypothetical protein